MTIRNIGRILTLSSTILMGIMTSQSMALAGLSPMKTIGLTSSPIGHVQFCKNYPSECKTHQRPQSVVQIDENSWRDLVQINAHFNKSIEPVTDQDQYRTAEYWAYPGQRGDCEDYVLAKRKALINRGWPASALLITVVREPNGTGHAVLTVRTDKAEFILDNQDPRILPWKRTVYQYVKRQSARHAGRWDSIRDLRAVVVGSVNN